MLKFFPKCIHHTYRKHRILIKQEYEFCILLFSQFYSFVLSNCKTLVFLISD